MSNDFSSFVGARCLTDGDRRGASLTPSESIYFDDGNLVLIAEQTAFRVHRGQLARHSHVWREMLAFPQPSLDETYDGCPVVHLADTAEEIGDLLTALYDSKKLEPKDFNISMHVLSLATKYDIPHLRENAFTALSVLYPATVRGWIDRPRDLDPNPLEVIRLAQAARCPLLLPCAYYMMCALSLEDLFSLDGASGLSIPELQVILQGREKISESWARWIFDFQGQINDIDHFCSVCCGRMKMIIAALRKAAFTRQGGVEWMAVTRKPLESLSVFHENPIVGICADCQPLLVSVIQKGITGFWEDLPSYYGLPSWEQLQLSQSTF